MGKKKSTEDGKVEVHLTLDFRGWVSVRMTREEADELLARIDDHEPVEPGDVPGFDWLDAVDQLDARVEDAEIVG